MGLDFERQSTLLATKMFIPRPRGRTIARQRLLTRLDGLLERRLALICAPAGYGKTTLLSTWILHLQDARAVWISLDKEDNEPLHFWHYVLTALHLSDLSLSAPQADEDRVLHVLLTRLLNEVAMRSEQIVLALDDYHVILHPTIHEGMTFLFEHSPPNFHIALATRSEPPLFLARLRVRQGLIELRQEDLRFTSAETTAFVSQEYHAGLDAQDLEHLEEQSEGWVAGLQLAVLSLQGRADTSAFIQRLSGSQRSIFDYLAEEVLANLAMEEQTFLLRTSILSRLCAGVCQALTDSAYAQDVLHRLVRANLFLVPLDEQGEWYRYHHLFAGALYQRLKQLMPAAIPELQRQAAMWYAQNGLIEEAFEHALAIPDFDYAARLLLSTSKQLLLRGEMRTLHAWIERLPEELVRSSPHLSLAYFWALADIRRLPQLERCLHDMQDALAKDSSLMNAEFELGLYSASSIYWRYCKDFAQAIFLLYRALELTPSTDFRQRCYLYLHLAEYNWSMGELGQAQQALRESLEASEAGGYEYFIATDWLYLARMQSLGGRLRVAEASYQRVLQRASDHAGHTFSLSGVAYLGLALLAYEQNDLATSQSHCKACEDYSQRAGDSHTLFYSSLLQAQIKLAQCDPVGARAILPDFELRPGDFDFFFPYDGFIELYTRIALALGIYEDAVLLLKQFDESCLSPLLREDLQLARTRLLLAHNDDSFELEALDHLLQSARMQGRRRSELRILLVRCLTCWRQGAVTSVEALVTHILTLAEALGCVRALVDEGEPLVALLRILPVPAPYSQKYLTRVLAAFPPTNASDAPINEFIDDQSDVLHEPLSEREREILRLIAAGHSNQEIASQLVIALSTLKTHINRMYGKLGVKSRTQALARARKLRLLRF